MDAILHVLLNWQFILVGFTAIGSIGLTILIKKKAPALMGLSQLLQSPSGIFALLALAAITYVTYKQPTVGGTAFAAFVAVVPTILAWVEHKETLLQMNQCPLPVPVSALSPPIAADAPLPPPAAPLAADLTSFPPPRGTM